MTEPSPSLSIDRGSLSTSGPRDTIAPVAIESFGAYTIVAKLGRGGMASVYLALASGPSGFQKLVVIKRLHPHLEADATIARMFHDEIKLASRLSHAHVVQTYEVGSFDGRPFLAMEYLDGQALHVVQRRSAERHSPLPPALAARVVSDTLDGLHYAHEASDYDGTPLAIVHRDVSPHNLFVTYDGRVKVLDFGIAKASTQQELTRAGIIKGKLAYIAPEQARGEPVDRRTDLWSVGVTMWELLAGRRLFRRGSDVATLEATLNDPIPLVTEVDASVPPELASICDHALQRDPSARWTSASAMKDALDEWIARDGNAVRSSALGSAMRELFAQEIGERRERIRECVERVRHGGVSARSSVVLPRLPDEPSAPSVSAARRAIPLPARSTGRGPMATGIALVLLIVVAFAWTTRVPPSSLVADVIAPQPRRAPDIAPAIPPTPVPPPFTQLPAATPTASSPPIERALGAAPSPPRPRGRAAHAPAPASVVETATTGHLSLDAAPYAMVSLGDRRLGLTPVELDLPAGTYTFSLRNAEYGIETRYRVVIRPGETIRRTVALE